MAMHTNQVKFCCTDESQAFTKRHSKLMEKLQPLFATLHKTFIRQLDAVEASDRVIFFLGRLSVEDFMEILLLCGNGYGIGGMKLLRGLYERAVTLGYIAKHPDQAEQFLEYHYIHQRKHFNHAKVVFPMNDLSPQQIEEIESNYQKVKNTYQEEICKKCGTTRTMFAWSKLDLLSMARIAGLDRLYLQCYYNPTLQAHATVSSMITRMKLRQDGGVSFDEGAQREKADLALLGAHNVILSVLDVVNEYFELQLHDELQDRFEDFKYVWERSG